MNKSVRIGSLVLSCAIAGAVFAQATPPVAPTVPGAAGAMATGDFSSIDTNKDGKVSATEAQSHSELRSAFSSLDADKDTYLSQSEFQKWNQSGKAGSMGSPSQSDRSGGASGATGAGGATGTSPSTPKSTDDTSSSSSPQ